MDERACESPSALYAGASPSLRLRRSRAAALLVDGSILVALDRITNERIECSKRVFLVLSAATSWQNVETLLNVIPGSDRKGVIADIVVLLDLGFLVIEGSAGARTESSSEPSPTWDARVGLEHFRIEAAEKLESVG